MHCSMPLKIAKKSKAELQRGGGRGGRVRIRWQGGGSLHLRPGTGQSDQHQHSLSNCCASLPVLAYASCLRPCGPYYLRLCLCLWAVCVICLMPLMKWLLWK